MLVNVHAPQLGKCREMCAIIIERKKCRAFNAIAHVMPRV